MAYDYQRYEAKLDELEEQALALKASGRYYLKTGLGLSLSGVGILAGLFAQEISVVFCIAMVLAGIIIYRH